VSIDSNLSASASSDDGSAEDGQNTIGTNGFVGIAPGVTLRYLDGFIAHATLGQAGVAGDAVASSGGTGTAASAYSINDTGEKKENQPAGTVIGQFTSISSLTSVAQYNDIVFRSASGIPTPISVTVNFAFYMQVALRQAGDGIPGRHTVAGNAQAEADFGGIHIQEFGGTGGPLMKVSGSTTVMSDTPITLTFSSSAFASSDIWAVGDTSSAVGTIGANAVAEVGLYLNLGTSAALAVPAGMNLQGGSAFIVPDGILVESESAQIVDGQFVGDPLPTLTVLTPEPCSVGLLVLGGISLLGRQRRT